MPRLGRSPGLGGVRTRDLGTPPAQPTRISTLPNFLIVLSTAFFICLRSVISQLTKRHSLPLFSTSFTVSTAPASLTSAITLEQPSSANLMAVARPMPVAPPLIMANLSGSSILFLLNYRLMLSGLSHINTFQRQSSTLYCLVKVDLTLTRQRQLSIL